MQGVSNQTASVMNTISTQRTPNSNNAQANLLKKALDAQKSDAAQLLQMLEGKGKIVDIRA